MKNAFTLIELLVVVAIIAMLVAILLPSLARAREQATVVAVHAELRQIGIALEMYMDDSDGKHPPTRQDCSMGWEDHQLPPELVAAGYLPPPPPGNPMSAGIEDRFNRDNTYKYWAVGPLIQNGRVMEMKRAALYVPAGFPHQEGSPETDLRYDDPRVSPVTWIVFSQGPKFDQWHSLKELHGPVPRRSWYNHQTGTGLITRLRLKGKPYEHLGSFDE